jgi:dihydroorotate dehydrogenase electron transfer subunit
MPVDEKVKILDHKKLALPYFKLTLFSEFISKNAQPGQFVQVGIPGVFLRRPLSVHGVNPKDKTFELLYEVIGPGTRALSQLKINQELDVLGPLGSGFKIESGKAVLVAGGMGIAPLCFLAKEFLRKNKAISVLIGAKSSALVLCEELLKKLGAQVSVATEDGSYGHKGLVTDLLFSQLTTHNSQLSSTIYSCGPCAMLKEVASLAKKKQVPCQISLEAYMACGIGACLGCAVETKSGYKMACKDGPVFNSEEIIW